ncbi:MAG: AAA family ATPase [Planctomycetota bacterium]
MRIEKIKLAGFGSFAKGIEVDFAQDRLALIIGRNEAGKSTLMSAVFGVIFGFKDQGLQKKFEPWDAYDEYAGEVWIRDEAKRLVVIKRNFADNTAEIGVVEDGKYEAEFLGSANPRGHSDEDIDYYRRIEKIVGFQDESVFRGTVFVGQSALEVSINDQIRRLVSGSGSTDFKGALHDLHSRFSELTMENPWRTRSKSRPRAIEKTRGQLEKTVNDLENARETFLKTMSLESELKKLETKLLASKNELEDTKKTLSYFERFCKLVRDRDTARERFKESNKRRDDYLLCRKQVGASDSEISASLSHFRQVGDSFPELVTQLKSETRELENEEANLQRERDALRTLESKPNNKLGIALGGLGLAVGVVVIILTNIGIGAVVAVALAAGLFFGGRLMATGFKERKAELEYSVEDQTRNLDRRTKAIQSLISESGGVLGDRDPDRILVDYRRYRKLMDDRAKQKSTMKVLGDWNNIDATYQRAAEETLRCNGLLDLILQDAPYLTEISEDAVAVAKSMEQLKRRANDLESEIDIGSEVVTEAKIELARVSPQEGQGLDLPVLEEEVRRGGRKLEHLEFERDSLRVVIDTLEDCVEEFQEGDLTQLSTEVSELFRKITSNRYTRVTLSPNMDPMLTKFDNTHIHPDDLSQGTRDQLFFAMRVAIARHLSKKVALPFFLDDPFVNFDEERLQVTKEMLEQISDHQVVLVTCDRSYESWSENVLDLDKARAESAMTATGLKLTMN